ncbi:MAG: hypothetical protein AAFX06_23095 [Planctomycetota bacterium]
MQEPFAKEANPNSPIAAEPENNLRYASDPTPEQAAALPKLTLSALDPQQSYEERCQQSLKLAEEAFAKTGSWVIFFREILGVDGVVRQLFQDPTELATFIEGPQYATLQEMLAAVRSQDQSKSDSAEPERMITIRIPRSLHDLLRVESEGCDLSINKLCISKLLQPIDSRFIPEQRGRRRGRRPGPQGSRPKRMASPASVDPLRE